MSVVEVTHLGIFFNRTLQPRNQLLFFTSNWTDACFDTILKKMALCRNQKHLFCLLLGWVPLALQANWLLLRPHLLSCCSSILRSWKEFSPCFGLFNRMIPPCQTRAVSPHFLHLVSRLLTLPRQTERSPVTVWLTSWRGDATVCLLQGGADHLSSVGAGRRVLASLLQWVQQMWWQEGRLSAPCPPRWVPTAAAAMYGLFCYCRALLLKY